MRDGHRGVVGSFWLHTGSFLINKLKLNQIDISIDISYLPILLLRRPMCRVPTND